MPTGRFSHLVVGDNLTGTDLGDGAIEISADLEVGVPSEDPAVWMPLTTVTAGVPELVWDGDDQLIPTLTPI